MIAGPAPPDRAASAASPLAFPGSGAAAPPEMRLTPLPLRAPEPPDNPGTAEKIALGRLLFFDPILSSTRDVSCATCHSPRWGWGDARPVPIGVGGAGVGPARMFVGPSSLPVLLRNTPTLLNVGFNGLVSGAEPAAAAAPMFWDSRASGLESQVAIPIAMVGEMSGAGHQERDPMAEAVRRVQDIPDYRERFRKAFEPRAGQAVTPEHLAQAIAAFERSLITPRAAIDRFLQGDTMALSAEQQRGLRVFQDAGCVHCHGGPMFSDFKTHYVGVPDSSPGGQRAFRTPTLRNLRYTAPYMHNGSLRTLREVLTFYDGLAEAVTETLEGGGASDRPPLDPLLKSMRLSDEDFPALESFFDSLSDATYDTSAPSTVPSGLPLESTR
ncbi:MAG: cytochrome-c peroxidase [Verrucomicrobia bacterium]|nr:cytochrome-c peroxidase [Verrucomicrobiota bacterium]MBI3869648.1 cytochrome-c peroxidase [Verrucomicrobiota bacterium]